MTRNSLVSLYMGTPQLEQLNDDLRAAEMYREAPRLSVTEPEFKAIRGDSRYQGGKLYTLVDPRESPFEISAEETLFDRSLGTFRLENGGLAFLVLSWSPVKMSLAANIRGVWR